jgi:hypothetical protein
MRRRVIFGSRDQIIAPDGAKLFEKVPGARVGNHRGPGHSPMVKTPDKTIELIKGFLADQQ